MSHIQFLAAELAAKIKAARIMAALPETPLLRERKAVVSAEIRALVSALKRFRALDELVAALAATEESPAKGEFGRSRLNSTKNL